MIALVMVFMVSLFFFGFIGASRGWAKEVLVIASVILALALITLMEDLLKLNQIIKSETVWYWVRMFILVTMVLFGYQSPKVPRISKATEKRGQIGDWLLGFLMGMLSGYFVIGTAWYYSDVANYPLLADYIRPPAANFAELTQTVLGILPPTWLDTPVTVFISVVLIFVFVIIFFL